MIVFYPAIKAVHIYAVLCSGLLFALRGILVARGSRWGMAAPIRYLSYSVDTVLLTAALMLLTILPAAVFANGWLAVKLVMLVGYVVLGTIALKRGRTQKSRALAFASAITVFLAMVGIARAHHPWGWLHTWLA